MKINKLIVVTLLLSLSGLVASQSAGDYEAPRTEWGQPDLQGVWNFSSDIPMQRPQRYGTQEFLTQDEIQERRDAIMAGRAAADAAAARINVPDVPDEGSNPGGHATRESSGASLEAYGKMKEGKQGKHVYAPLWVSHT